MLRSDGFLVVDKPPGLTSHDVVAVIRAVTGIPKVGHTGTLDPFATGVLPLALGRTTRFIQYLDEGEKEYDATVLLGIAMDTGDPTGTVIAEQPVPDLSQKKVLEILASFLGPRMQTPPRYSAVKVGGRPLYDYARAGTEVKVEARPIQIYGMSLLEFAPPRIRVLIRCSRGTYARVIAEELGTALGTVAHLEALRRSRSGPFVLDRALTLGQLSEAVAGDPSWDRVLRPGRGEARVAWRRREEVVAGLQRWILPAMDVLRHLPAVTLTDLEAKRFSQGITPARATGLSTPCALLYEDDVLSVVPAGSTGIGKTS